MKLVVVVVVVVVVVFFGVSGVHRLFVLVAMVVTAFKGWLL